MKWGSQRDESPPGTVLDDKTSGFPRISVIHTSDVTTRLGWGWGGVGRVMGKAEMKGQDTASCRTRRPGRQNLKR